MMDESPTPLIVEQCAYCDDLSVYRCPLCQRYVCDLHAINGDHRCGVINAADLPTAMITDSAALLLFDVAVLRQLAKDLLPLAGLPDMPRVELDTPGYTVVFWRMRDMLYYRINGIGANRAVRHLGGPYSLLKTLLQSIYTSHRQIIYEALSAYALRIKSGQGSLATRKLAPSPDEGEAE